MKIVAILGLTLGACTAGAADQGPATVGQRSFQVGAFEAVSLEGPYHAVVTVGGAASVRAEGDSALLERLDVRVEGNRLIIETRDDAMNWSRGDRTATVYVTAPSLNAAALAGSGDMRVGPLQAARFTGSVAGSGDLMLERVQAQSAQFSIAGSGTVRAAGQTGQAAINIAGSGDAELAELQADTADISIAGSGDARLRATGTAAVNIVGSGSATVSGGARCTVNRLGSGEARCS